MLHYAFLLVFDVVVQEAMSKHRLHEGEPPQKVPVFLQKPRKHKTRGSVVVKQEDDVRIKIMRFVPATKKRKAPPCVCSASTEDIVSNDVSR